MKKSSWAIIAGRAFLCDHLEVIADDGSPISSEFAADTQNWYSELSVNPDIKIIGSELTPSSSILQVSEDASLYLVL